MSNKARAWLVESFRQNALLGYLAIVRILVGYHFLRVAWPKLMRGYWQGDSLPRQLAEIAGDPISLHREFILNVVLPHPVLYLYAPDFFRGIGRAGVGH